MSVARAEPARSVDGRDAAAIAAAVAIAVVGGALVVRSTQLALTMTLLLLLLAVRVQSRTAGLSLMWTYWLLAPFLRRVLDNSIGPVSPDPLSLLPFLATALLAAIELRHTHLDKRARTIMTMGTVGLLIGAPLGLAADPSAAGFAIFAYGTGLSAFILGWGDGQLRDGTGSLQKIVMYVLPILALYGLAQYFFSLTSWDAHWVATTTLNSLGSPQEGHVRIFSTLNAPYTFAALLGTGLLLGLARRGRAGLAPAITALLVVALALTFMRSVWLGTVIGLIVFAAAARGRAAGRIVVVVGVCLFALIVVGNSNPTTKAFTERVTSLGNPNEDRSAQERLATTNKLFPVAVRQPLGEGAGQAGMASELTGSHGGSSALINVDDGYLSLMFQDGPFGFLLVIGALVLSVGAAIKAVGAATEEERQPRAALLATLIMLLVALAAGDILFGLPGMMLWYLCGTAVAWASKSAARPTSAQPSRVR
ncbi:MAG TPA: O-antigen ligase family protein [Solirubrobacterales bacterium]|nr:O-antigen ligase family protein [Solirubrobacterales bacterium]